MAGKTDVRWSDTEWVSIRRWAEALNLRPGQFVKAAVLEKIGSAAPRERKSSAAPALGNRAGCGDGGLASAGDALGSGGDFGTGPAAASSRSAEFDGLREAVMSNGANLPVIGPAGSAGSAVRPPAGGSAAGSPAVAEPAEEGVSLVEACVAVLVAQGVAAPRARLLALREIRAGRVEVSGEVCSDPERLVDPASLGAPS